MAEEVKIYQPFMRASFYSTRSYCVGCWGLVGAPSTISCSLEPCELQQAMSMGTVLTQMYVVTKHFLIGFKTTPQDEAHA